MPKRSVEDDTTSKRNVEEIHVTKRSIEDRLLKRCDLEEGTNEGVLEEESYLWLKLIGRVVKQVKWRNMRRKIKVVMRLGHQRWI